MSGAINCLEYDDFEKSACKILPNRIIEAFKPEAFQIVGYPISVNDESELYKYVDPADASWSVPEAPMER